MLPVSEWLQSRLQAWRKDGGDRVAAVSRIGDYKSNNGEWTDWHREALREMGFDPIADPETHEIDERCFGHHDFRRTCESLMTVAYGSDLAKALDGHAVRDVSTQSYVDMTPKLVETVNDWPTLTLIQAAIG